ncbi:MAG: chitobiase/beta-hexosaminidase C-terminal domain-containing protein [Verrucomicrobia bacterium]|nr:chitobiase/beta-hexosaminidase C-terminal domain-containing protein [Verrucomicrobiota bacterium]
MVPDIDAGVLKVTVQAAAGSVRVIARDGQTKVGEASGKPDQVIGTGEVELKSVSDQAKIVYTLDGNEPLAGSPIY